MKSYHIKKAGLDSLLSVFFMDIAKISNQPEPSLIDNFQSLRLLPT